MRAWVFMIGGVAAVAGCRGYQAGSFRDFRSAFPGERATVGCLDIAVAETSDTAAEGPVAALAFANRCDAAVVVDLSAIRATGWSDDGASQPLGLFDPAGEIRPLTLEARGSGREVIELVPQQPAPIGRVCLDLAGVDRDARIAQPVVVCLAAAPRAPEVW